jgi:galactonate dehydratase
MRIACDMHWKHTALAATRLIDRMHAHDLWFAEAPVAPEDIEGQKDVAAKARTSIAMGEEWAHRLRVPTALDRAVHGTSSTGDGAYRRHGVHEDRPHAEAFHCRIIPHASIGIGIFQAASLHASVALQNCDGHEYQHSIFDRNLQFIEGDMACADGTYRLPRARALGVAPNAEVWRYARKHEPPDF